MYGGTVSICVEKTRSGEPSAGPAYTFHRGPSLPSPACGTGVFSTAHPRPARNSARKSPAAPSQYVVESISASSRVNTSGSSFTILGFVRMGAVGFGMALPEYRTAAITLITRAHTITTGMISSARRTLRSIPLAGPNGRLEALLNEGSPDAPFAALVSHPHPPSGGTMHNKVVYHAMKTMNAPEWGFEWPVLRFNFRGTGLSEGAYDGSAEAEDVSSALDWLKNEYHRPIVAVGFSFGAAMTLAACCARCGSAQIQTGQI